MGDPSMGEESCEVVGPLRHGARQKVGKSNVGQSDVAWRAIRVVVEACASWFGGLDCGSVERWGLGHWLQSIGYPARAYWLSQVPKRSESKFSPEWARL